MFVRKKLNKGGSYSILLIEGVRKIGKRHSTPIIIKNFGSAKGDKEIAILMRQAEEYKVHLENISPKPRTLKISSDLDIKSCRSYNTGFSDVYGKCFDSVFSESGLKPGLASKLRDLSIMRIAAPASKLKTTKISDEYGIDLQTVDSVYKLMDQLTVPVINNIKKTIYDHTAKLLAEQNRTIDVLFYDLTTVYFETQSQDELRDFGFSKDGKHQHVQIMLAVIVTKDGLPIDYEEFPGNCFEGHTLIPVLEKISLRYNIDKVVLVADAALMNKINLQDLSNRKINYVIASRIKNANHKLKQEILDISSYTSISRTDGDEIKAKVIAADSTDDSFIIAYHSAKRARKDEYDRQKTCEKIERYIGSAGKSKLTSALKKPYIKITKDCKIEIDIPKLSEQKRYDGFFGLHTNIKDPNPNELLSLYRGLWQVEQTFRIAKSNLEIRPVFHYSPRRIRAHFIICYMALALVRYVEFALKCQNIHTPCQQLHILFDKMRKVKIVDQNNITFEFLEEAPPDLVNIYQALHITWPKKLSHKINL